MGLQGIAIHSAKRSASPGSSFNCHHQLSHQGVSDQESDSFSLTGSGEDSEPEEGGHPGPAPEVLLSDVFVVPVSTTQAEDVALPYSSVTLD